ncbi:MAG: prepilin peptidase [Deltaproteobacteria bacterium]|nr:prepilin peptidase [Deltaproteobacteria bacterium]
MISDLPFGYILFAAFVFGLIIGSFLNVCIHRLPLSQSISAPRSRCPHCMATISWYDNIPLVSYVILRGRCRSCKAWISLRYPLVELLSGIFAVATVLRFGLTASGLGCYMLVCALIVVTFIDLDYQIIPDVITLPGVLAGFGFSFVMVDVSWKASLLGILAGGGSLLAVAWGYQFLTGKDGMGGGDIKLMAMLGAFLGPLGILFTLMAGALTGSVIGVALMIFRKEDGKMAVPFGPFLAIGAILYIFFGPPLVYWYLGLFSPPGA